MSMNTGQIEVQLEKLEREYRGTLIQEIIEVRAQSNAEEFTDFLLGLARSSTSTWSGAHSSKNMCEQIKREVAIDRLSEHQFGRKYDK